ncbi:cytochrome c [Plectonema cf. radiosum LEGE 06105]|uniref:Cytochrome c n=1 Tax=Plectonema cf. radiosum LEGE 06105 TaxID=945769 RepID=A0A8J7K3M5_9CYAN|nr:cytochrome c [Plectonema cf. radiosum LEGE 06105]
MDNQITKPDTLIGRIALFTFAVLLAILAGIFAVDMVKSADPYIQNVLSLQGNPVQGHAIFQINCAGCHGLEATGSVGPSLKAVSKRKSRYGMIHQVISGETPPMPKFQPSAKEMADLLSYLETL